MRHTKQRPPHSSMLFAGMLVVGLSSQGCGSGGGGMSPGSARAQPSRSNTVTVTYRSAPNASKPIPKAVRSVAVLEPAVKLDASMGFGAQGLYQVDWNQILTDRLQRQMSTAYPDLIFNERGEDMALNTQERRRRDLGYGGGGDEFAGHNIPVADANVVARISWQVEKVNVPGERIDLWRTIEGATRGRLFPKTRKKNECELQVIVNCSLTMDFPASQTVFHKYAATIPFEQRTRDPVIFDIGGQREWDLELVSEVIEKLMDQHIAAFLEPMIPTVMRTATIEHPSDAVRHAARLINRGRGGDAQATQILRDAWAQSRDAQAAFLMGILAEEHSDFRAARAWYQLARERDQAQSQYVDATQRLDFYLSKSGYADGEDAFAPDSNDPDRIADRHGE